MSKVVAAFHIVFATKKRERTIPMLHRNLLYNTIRQILEEKRCKVIKTNGMSDHVHILVDLHPDVSISAAIKAVKQETSAMMQQSTRFGFFAGWGRGYYAMSVSPSHIAAVKGYIENQEQHHMDTDTLAEFERLMQVNGLAFYPDEIS